MAKFCGNCGNQLDDSARVCGYCGTVLDEVYQPASSTNYGTLGKRASKGKTIKCIVIMIVIAGLLFGGFKLVSEFTGYKGLVRNVMKAYESYDIDHLIDMSSDVWFYEMADYVKEYFERTVGNNLDHYEESVGHNYKFSYEVDEIYEPSERRLMELEEDVQEIYYDFDLGMVEKVMIARVKVTVEKGGKMVSSDVVLTLTKESGEWRLLCIE